ncbi:MAG: RagB/SusD family nutrient uptake outer membrane protein [Balneolaceae bacterium]|nr:RagB/SusD family nutrient uptake outer membrane protein [Balneolaceae bacterium]
MKKFNKSIRKISILVLVFVVAMGCDLDVSNPNAPTDEDVLNSAEGIEAYTVGMQGYFAGSVYDNIVLNTGVTTREVAINTTFTSLIELEEGGTALPPENSRVNSIWIGLMRLINMNDQILNNAPGVINVDADLSGIIALSSVYKAMALGYAVQSFEQSPLSAGNNAEFASREEVLTTALNLLDNAQQQISSTPPSDNFNNSIMLSGFDLQNTIYALQARYNLFAGNYQEAIDAANQVDVSATSVFSYDGSTSRNPLFDGVASGDEGQEYAPRDNFGTSLFQSGDQRLDFYLNSVDESSTPNGLPIDELVGFATTPDADIPVYLPGEMALIKAEAYVRLGAAQYPNAVVEINNVRTKTAAEDPFGVGAELPPYSGPVTEEALLEEIFYQRSAELYLSGMRFEDMRRLNRPVPSDDPPLTAPRNRVYYPYPTQERQNNPNTPANPAI